MWCTVGSGTDGSDTLVGTTLGDAVIHECVQCVIGPSVMDTLGDGSPSTGGGEGTLGDGCW